MSIQYRSFGGPDAYYAQKEVPTLSEAGHGNFLYKILNSQQEDLRDRVKLCVENRKRGFLKNIQNEMRLSFSKDGKGKGVKINVVDGFPHPMLEVIKKYDNPEIWNLLLKRQLVDQTVSGLRLAIQKFDLIRELDGMSGVMENNRALRGSKIYFKQLQNSLGELELLDKIFAIDEDILGAYYFRIPEIRIYWMAITIMSSVLRIDVEGLTSVVLIHELVHAYSHLGKDVDISKWATEDFAAASLGIVEGIAQYYTHIIANKLNSSDPAILDAFKKFLVKQTGPYLVHEEWLEMSDSMGEAIRYAMLTTRNNSVKGYNDFQDILKDGVAKLRTINQTSSQMGLPGL